MGFEPMGVGGELQGAEMNEILNVKDMAGLLDCEPKTVEAGLRDKLWPGVKVGRSWICPRTAAMEALHVKAMENMVKAPAQAKAVKVKAVRPVLREV